MVATEQIARTILALRGQRVLLDTELAAFYSVTTKALNQAVARGNAMLSRESQSWARHWLMIATSKVA